MSSYLCSFYRSTQRKQVGDSSFSVSTLTVLVPSLAAQTSVDQSGTNSVR